MARIEQIKEQLARLRLQWGALVALLASLIGWFIPKFASGDTEPGWLVWGAFAISMYLLAMLLAVDWTMLQKIKKLGDLA